jgi:hypothetical protein
MVLLQSMDVFDNLAELSTSTGQVSWLSKHAHPELTSHPVHGSIAQLHGRTLCLYRQEGVLHFRVDHEDFELTKETSIKLERVRDRVNSISVLRSGTPLFTWAYQRPTIDPPLELDPTPFVDEEDFDFCLFVHNVMNDPSRRERIYR